MGGREDDLEDEHGGAEPSKDDDSSLGAFEGNAGPAARGGGDGKGIALASRLANSRSRTRTR